MAPAKRQNTKNAQKKEGLNYTIMVAGALCSALVGTMYGYSHVKQKMKDAGDSAWQDAVELGYYAGFIGQYMAFIPGMIFDKFGAPITIAYGSAMAGVGFSLAGFAVASQSSTLLYCGIWMAGQGSKGLGFGTMLGSIRALPDSWTATISGIYLGFDALSAIFAMTAYDALFANDDIPKSEKGTPERNFFVAMGIFIAACGVVTAVVYKMFFKPYEAPVEEVADNSDCEGEKKKTKAAVTETKTFWFGVIAACVLMTFGESQGLAFNSNIPDAYLASLHADTKVATLKASGELYVPTEFSTAAGEIAEHFEAVPRYLKCEENNQGSTMFYLSADKSGIAYTWKSDVMHRSNAVLYHSTESVPSKTYKMKDCTSEGWLDMIQVSLVDIESQDLRSFMSVLDTAHELTADQSNVTLKQKSADGRLTTRPIQISHNTDEKSVFSSMWSRSDNGATGSVGVSDHKPVFMNEEVRGYCFKSWIKSVEGLKVVRNNSGEVVKSSVTVKVGKDNERVTFDVSPESIEQDEIGNDQMKLWYDKHMTIDNSKKALVITFVLTNAVGRLASGMMSDVTGKMTYFPTSFYIMLFTLTYILGFALFTFLGVFYKSWGIFVGVSGLIGLSYGGIFTIVTAYMKQKVQKEKLGMVLGFSLMVMAIGGMLFGKIFTKASEKELLEGAHIGHEFRQGFFKLALFCNLACLPIAIYMYMVDVRANKQKLAEAESDSDSSSSSSDEDFQISVKH